MGKVKRSLFITYMDDLTATPDHSWNVVGGGISTAKIEYNPKLSEQTDIDQDNSHTTVESYAPKMPLEYFAGQGPAYDPTSTYIFEFVENLRKTRGILGDVETWIMNVYYYGTAYGDCYDAEVQKVAISLDSFGGDGGAAIKESYTVNYIGDPVWGLSWWSSGKWGFSDQFTSVVPTAHQLTSLDVGGETLDPVFDATRPNYNLAVSHATTTLAISSVLAGSTITQYKLSVDGLNTITSIIQGGDITLDVGVNHLVIQVDVGAIPYRYYIAITRAA